MIGQTTTTGRADDLIDAMLCRTGGEVLSPPTSEHGEWDFYREHVSRRDLRRLVAAGLVRRVGGLPADRLAHVYGWDGDASTFVEMYLTQCLAGLDHRAGVRAGDVWAEREPSDDDYAEACAIDEADGMPQLPPVIPTPAESAPLAAYLARLVHPPKRVYAKQVADAIATGAPIPVHAGTWAPDVVRRVSRYLRTESRSAAA